MSIDIRRSLTDIAGEKYIDAVCRSAAALGFESHAELRKIADEKVDFFPEEFARRSEELTLRCGEKIADGLDASFPGAGDPLATTVCGLLLQAVVTTGHAHLRRAVIQPQTGVCRILFPPRRVGLTERTDGYGGNGGNGVFP